MAMTSRTERDSFGAIEVPADRYWGAQTQRALQHFRIGEDRMPAELIHALGLVKQACAVVNGQLGLLPPERAAAIAAAAAEVAAGRLDDHFPLPVWQTGSATQTHMNVNEVVANRARERMAAAGTPAAIHPNDDVNRSQSSNDVVPTAMHVATVSALATRLRPALGALRATLGGKAGAFADIVKIGRTHLQDAVPLTLGQEISAWVRQLELAEAAIDAALPALHELAIGGTAVGTGLNAPPGFGERVASLLAEWTGRPLVAAANRFAALAGHEALVTAHGALRTLAVALIKIANDVRWLASGPRSGLGELTIPENEPGSSIMPGKVNPTQAEALVMVATQVLGHDVAVGLAGASGSFQLNVARPLIAHDVLRSIRLLADAVASFDEHCARGIEPDRARIREHLDRSLMLVTALAPRLGYDRAAAIARQAHHEGRTLREVAVGDGHLTAAEFEELVRPERMTGSDPVP